MATLTTTNAYGTANAALANALYMGAGAGLFAPMAIEGNEHPINLGHVGNVNEVLEANENLNPWFGDYNGQIETDFKESVSA